MEQNTNVIYKRFDNQIPDIHNNFYTKRLASRLKKVGVTCTLECDIDHMVGLFGRFSLFHTCIDQKIHQVVYYSHMDSCVV